MTGGLYTWQVVQPKTGIVVSVWKTFEEARADAQRRDEKYKSVDNRWPLQVRGISHA